MRGHYVGAEDSVDAKFAQLDAGFESIASDVLRAMGVDRTDMTWDQSAFAKDPAGYARRMSAIQATKEHSPLYPVWQQTVSPALDEWRAFYRGRDGGASMLVQAAELARWAQRFAMLKIAAAQQMQDTAIVPATEPPPFTPFTSRESPPMPPRSPQAWPMPPVSPYSPPPADQPKREWVPYAIGAGVVGVLAVVAFATSR